MPSLRSEVRRPVAPTAAPVQVDAAARAQTGARAREIAAMRQIVDDVRFRASLSDRRALR
jgi:hypothetical protein